MLRICLVFWKSEPQYAYKRYAYKKTCMLIKSSSLRLWLYFHLTKNSFQLYFPLTKNQEVLNYLSIINLGILICTFYKKLILYIGYVLYRSNAYCTVQSDKDMKGYNYTLISCFEACKHEDVDLFYYRTDDGKCVCYHLSEKGRNCEIKAGHSNLYLIVGK